MSPQSPPLYPFSPPMQEHDMMSPPANAPGSPGQSTLAHYRNLREQKVAHLTQGSTTAYLQEQALKLRTDFKKRLDEFMDKQEKKEKSRMLRMSYVILKANVKRRKQERRDVQIAEMCSQKLEYLKKRRVFRSLKVFTNW